MPPEGTERDAINEKLKEVVSAIKNKSGDVKFYDLKTRLQMFFLYQSKKTADDVRETARTLWEYAICNMDKENLEKGPDKSQGFYDIRYYKGNIEFDTGYINMLKLMWNMAKALNLGAEEISAKNIVPSGIDIQNLLKDKDEKGATEDAEKTKLEWCKIFIDNILPEGKYNKVSFECALQSIFSLFCTGKIKVKTEYVSSNVSEIVGDVKVSVYDSDGKKKLLSFEIDQSGGHAEVMHNPISFELSYSFLDVDGLKEDYKFAEAELLLRNFVSSNWIPAPKGFYGAYSEEKLAYNDDFKNTDLYKKYEALSVFDALQGEETNVKRIVALITPEVVEGVQMINLDGKELSKVFYERYLKSNSDKLTSYAFKLLCIVEKDLFGELTEIYSDPSHENKLDGFSVIKSSKVNNEVRLMVREGITDLTIPSNIYDIRSVYDKDGKEYNVVSDFKNRFVNLESVTLLCPPDDVNINKDMFWVTESLCKVNFKGTFKKLTIGENAFKFCKNLTAFNISECDQLSELEIKLGNGLTGELKIPASVKKLTIGSFYNRIPTLNLNDCINLKELVIQGRIFIGRDLTGELKIPASVEKLTIGENAFNRSTLCKIFNMDACSNLKELIIEKNAFECSSLTGELKIPASVEKLTIGSGAFRNCRSLTINMDKCNNLNELAIEDGEFKGSSLKIPASVKKLTIGNFYNQFLTFNLNDCINLKELVIQGRIFTVSDLTGELKIPASVEKLTIGKNAFNGSTFCKIFNMDACSNLKELIIEKNAFEGSSLTGELKIPASVEKLTIGENAFNRCQSLTIFNMEICSNLKELKIEEEAFKGSGLTGEFKIPASVEKLRIGFNIFRNCKKLTTFNISENEKWEGVSISDKAFKESGLTGEFKIPKNVKRLTINVGAFQNCEKLTAFNIFECEQLSKLKICDEVFEDSGLTEFKIPRGVEDLDIDNMAFAGCKSLKTFKIEAGGRLKKLSIGRQAFLACGLKDIIIPERIETLDVDEVSFAGFKGTVYIPKKFANECKRLKLQGNIVYYTDAADLMLQLFYRKDNTASGT